MDAKTTRDEEMTMTNLATVANQVRDGIRVDVEALREAGHRELATLIEDRIDDETTGEGRDVVIAAIERAALSEYARLTARDNDCDRATAVRMMADEIGEVSRETGIDEDAVREWIRAQG